MLSFRNRAAAVLLAASVAHATASVIYVNVRCGNDAWSGKSRVCEQPDGPKATIQAGIDAAVDGDTVLVADGVYVGPGNKNLDFGGRLIVVRSQRGPDNCTIRLQGNARGFYFHNGETSAAVLRGFRIVSGSVTDESPGGGFGGGILCESSSPTIIDCQMDDNECTADGGGLAFTAGGNPTIRDCSITDNVALGNGGGIFNQSNSLTMTNCRFWRNRAGGDGGGMFNLNSSPIVTDCVFWRSTAGDAGGAMYNAGGSSPTVTNCRFSENSARDSGGGMHNAGGSSPKVTNCRFSENAAGSSDSRGGGMYNAGGPQPSTPLVINSTFADNRARTGGGMYTESGARYPTVKNSVLWDNQGGALGGPGKPTVTYSDIEGGYEGQGNINEDPLFFYDYRCLPGSPCIDAADNGAVPDGIETDADGDPRFVDDPDTQDTGKGESPIVDMGAYEFQAVFCDPCDMNCDGSVDLTDIEPFIECLLGCEPCGACVGDVNGDGSFDLTDVEGFIECLLDGGAACPARSARARLSCLDK